MVCVDNNSLYVFGGCGPDGRLSDLHRYDLTTSAWEEMPHDAAIEGRGGAELVVVPGRLLVLGGFSGHENNDVHAFDLETQTWSTVSDDTHLIARSVFCARVHECPLHEACAHSGHIVVYGGETDPSNTGHAGVYHCFDRLNAHKWCCVPEW